MKELCPVCLESECYKESFENIDSYLCMNCGYTTTSKHVADSIEIRKWELTTAELIKDSKYVDTNTNLVWYPSVLNFPSKGLIFPDGTNVDDWKWRVALTIPIPEEDRAKYPVPGKSGEFYETRIDMQNSKLYPRTEFKHACEDLGILEKQI